MDCKFTITYHSVKTKSKDFLLRPSVRHLRPTTNNCIPLNTPLYDVIMHARCTSIKPYL